MTESTEGLASGHHDINITFLWKSNDRSFATKLSGAVAAQHHLEEPKDLSEKAWLVDWNGKVLKEVSTPSRNTSGMAVGGGYVQQSGLGGWRGVPENIPENSFCLVPKGTSQNQEGLSPLISGSNPGWGMPSSTFEVFQLFGRNWHGDPACLRSGRHTKLQHFHDLLYARPSLSAPLI